ncbi:hypothetical protein AK812_SmicGene20117 [Symbiodinium microadriaticum]|uniref:Uncharacterized protein n=1 Tax=Symbiodinium microadriaticum TaxID=2951 RepID=A0A1Q9DQU4_SYMMI|nr:hypothetical protein AK812_SmicGene20117 [Symbiodinium microadriaticum]
MNQQLIAPQTQNAEDNGKKGGKKVKPQGKKNGKKNHKKNQKEKNEKEEQAEEEKARAIGQLSKMIREHNAKIAELDGLLGTESKGVQKAFRKDLDDCIAKLTACRANLQAAVDSEQEDNMLTMTDGANELMKKMQSEIASTSEFVFDMIDNVAAAGSINREMRSAKSTVTEDAAGLLPAPLKKLGTFSGKNSARDFAEVNEDESVATLDATGLNSRLHHTFREEDAMRSRSICGQEMLGKSSDQNGKIPPSFLEKTPQNGSPQPVCKAQKLKRAHPLVIWWMQLPL